MRDALSLYIQNKLRAKTQLSQIYSQMKDMADPELKSKVEIFS